MNILAIETSSGVGSLSVWQGESEKSWVGNREISRSVDLLLAISRILSKSRLDKRDLEAILVSEGPGSFTGLRVGISSGQGLATALGIKCIGVSILEALALAATFGSSRPMEVTSLLVLTQNRWCRQSFTVMNNSIISSGELGLFETSEMIQIIEENKSGRFAIETDTYQRFFPTFFSAPPTHLLKIEQNLATWVGLRGKQKLEEGDDLTNLRANYLV